MEPLDLKQLLTEFRADPQSARPVTVQKALFLARRLQERATELQTPSEKRQQAELDRMLQTPSDKATLAQMTDQAFRTTNPHRAVEHLIHILDVQGVPRFFGPWDRTLMKGFQSFGAFAPGVALPLVKEHMQKETANVILPGEKEMVTYHLRERTREGVRMNVNFLGETILSEAESDRRLQQYLTGLQWPEIEVVSIKISTLYSQISPLAREHTVATLCDRLERLFRSADRARFTRPDGKVVPKFVYLDMEEYRDKELTAEAFIRTLDRPGLTQVRAGIALQSYVPDTFCTLLNLQAWARRRVAAGGGRITIRLVKGANMEMERAEASVRGWPQAPCKTKVETDANYKRMVHEVMKPGNLAAMDVGVASHNLFDLAYGLVLALEAGALDRVQFEMLEGMANQQRRALFELSRNLLLYAPACKKENFINAIGYLIRRLDENTGPENFLRHAFKIKVGTPEWQQLEKGFLASFDAITTVSGAPRRTQNRQLPPANPAALAHGWQHLNNEPDTDFALPQNGEWASQIIAKWQPLCGDRAAQIPLVIAGAEILEGRAVRKCLDPSRPGVVVGKYRPATADDVTRAVECAAADPDGWRNLAPRPRSEILGKVAQELRVARGNLMGAALADGGKTLPESDPEVSEAIDFLEFYRDVALRWQELPGLKARAKGVVVVVSPWNFPIAIPCGGVAASLAAGNTVILKPASDTVLVASELCQCFWRAGVSMNALQFVPCSGGKEGRKLVNHPHVNAVILTGGTATALAMFRDNPRLSLFAETGGKDATIVTAVSDRDQAIKHILHSAFSHAGQKCSATSLLLLQDEVYDDPAFRRALCEAAQSLKVGSAWELETKIGPLIRPPGGDLETALKVLEPGEEWALMPRTLEGNPNLWSPGIKYGVSPGSFTHLTEFFGPVLAVMRFELLSEAVALVNQTGYGLTSGLESLDEREWDYWKQHLRAGNLYINRVTTGAIVLRQPFGGMGKSVFGPGMKAGGPNYVAQFMDFTDVATATTQAQPAKATLASLCEGLRARKHPDAARAAAAAASYEAAQRDEFGREHDHFKLVGQDNIRRYLPCENVRVRVHADDTPFELFARVCAAHVAGCRVTVSVPPGSTSPAVSVLEELTESWAGDIEFVEETDDQLATALRAHQTDRVRYAAADRVPVSVLQAANEVNICVASVPVSGEGRLELLWYVREQSVSTDYHRYGNLGRRAGEPRAEVL
ncbi:MAG TPA: bifunctional proline dehydrogenase/L-glutamate gamma-semialdehyde dehydrogenase [Candidatus Acidoferrum sp.]|jgi:RHH-type proline utilization regulon transcriptional repressor/proline dehydrogenase/delta 1-pyrroline-5-carboxylate dehydrogenase|nr:bifunctional proline dehydrogenase/L-glutamate gamma-semialdehyde dehydrogenase [Candidatus Acidoferrum sp.]